MFWVSNVSDDDSSVWCRMEQYLSNPVSLHSLICSPLPLSKHCWTNNPIISGCLKIWSQFRIHFKHKQALVTSPILANINFAPSLTDPSFQLWHRRGIKCVMDLFKKGHFISFEQLKKDFSIPQSHFFRYLPFQMQTGRQQLHWYILLQYVFDMGYCNSRFCTGYICLLVN